MSAHAVPGPPEGRSDGAPLHGDVEEVDGLPVLLAETRIVQARTTGAGLTRDRRAAAMMPAVQAAAVAAGGFVAGAAVAGLVHRRNSRSGALAAGRRTGRELARPGRGSGRFGRGSSAGELMQVVSTRTMLVDVHVLGRAPGDG